MQRRIGERAISSEDVLFLFFGGAEDVYWVIDESFDGVEGEEEEEHTGLERWGDNEDFDFTVLFCAASKQYWTAGH